MAQAQRSADLAAAEGGLAVDAAQLARLQRDALAEVLGEAVQHADGLVAEAQIRVHFLQHPVDVDLQGAGACQGGGLVAKKLRMSSLLADTKACHAEKL